MRTANRAPLNRGGDLTHAMLTFVSTFTPAAAPRAALMRTRLTDAPRPPRRPRVAVSPSPPIASAAAPTGGGGNESEGEREHAELARALADDGSKAQVLALLRLRAMPAPAALALLRGSGALESEIPRVRMGALDTLARLGGAADVPMLVATLRRDTDHSVRGAAAAALAMIPLSAPAVESGAVESNEATTTTATTTSSSSSPSSPSSPSHEGGSMPTLRMQATAALRAAAVEDPHFIVRYAAVVALGNIADVDAVPLLRAVAADDASPPLEAAAAVEALGEALAPPVAATAAAAAAAAAAPADDAESGGRGGGVTPDERCVQVVVARATDQDELVRAAVARTLGRWRAADGVEDVLRRMFDDEQRVGQSAMVEAVLRDVIDGRMPPL